MKEEFRILSTTAILGYDFPENYFKEWLKKKPNFIAVDAGSTDPGPYYLGAGVYFTDRDAVKRDLEIMITSGIENNIPVIIGTAGGSGAEVYLNWCKYIIDEIAKEKKLSFKLALIHSEFQKEDMKKALINNKIKPLDHAPPLTEKEIDKTTIIVGQMRIEPFIKVLKENAQVILIVRTYDPSVFEAPAIYSRYDKGIAIHLGKILECASIFATQGSGSEITLNQRI